MRRLSEREGKRWSSLRERPRPSRVQGNTGDVGDACHEEQQLQAGSSAWRDAVSKTSGSVDLSCKGFVVLAGSQHDTAKAHSVKGDIHMLPQVTKLLVGSLPEALCSNPAHTMSDVPPTWEDLDHAEEHSAVHHRVAGWQNRARNNGAVYLHGSRSYK